MGTAHAGGRSTCQGGRVVNSLKTVIVVAVMAVVAYGVYATLTKGPADQAAVTSQSRADGKAQAPAPAPKFIASQPAAAAPEAEQGHKHPEQDPAQPETVKAEPG